MIKETVYNTDLALIDRNDSSGHRPEERMPEELEVGRIYPFIKKGHRTYEPFSEVTLLEMKRSEVLFSLVARVTILSVEYVVEEGQSYTKGEYRVEELLQA